MTCPMRIVSLLASGTEILCGLGAGASLVGRSHECDHPAWVRALPACTRPAFAVDGTSRDIDAEVRRRLRGGEPLYLVDHTAIERLNPDLLITQSHCEVCAVTPADITRGGSAARRMVSLAASTVDAIYDGIRLVADAIGRPHNGEHLIGRMRADIQVVSAMVRDASRPRVALIEWTDPIFTSGNWVPELVAAAGGEPVLAPHGVHSAMTAWESIVAADPDYLIVAPCGFDLARTRQEIHVLEALPGWAELRAVRSRQAAFADGNRFFNRSGTTIVETTQILAEILHGDRVARWWHGRAWCDIPITSATQATG
jgi:iron complex transport system substrate-binding protein